MARARGPAGSPRDAVWIGAVTLGCLLPFLGKAFHVDDHRYVALARQLLREPLDPFGITINLTGSEQPIAYVANSPLLGPAWMAAASRLVGFGEVGLHLAFLPAALSLVLGTWWLARRLTPDPRVAALACLATPAVLVSASTVMPSVLMLGLFCLSLGCWIRALDGGGPAWGLAAGVLAALSALTKYFGMALVPLLLAYALLRERRVRPRLAWLLLPVGALLAFGRLVEHAYGIDPVLGAAGYAVATRSETTPAFERALVTFVFAGGVLAPVLFFVPSAFTRRMTRATLGLGALAFAVCLAHGELAGVSLRPAAGADAGLLLHVGVFTLAGAAVVVLAAADLARRPDADALLLALWIAGTFVFAAFVNYTTNARVLLPLAPPVALLVARALGAAGASPRARLLPLAPALGLALLATWGDAALADASRTAARRITARHGGGPGTLWFEGYWGFQHYMREHGARSVDVRRDVLRPGDRLVTPANAFPKLSVSPRAATEVETLELPLPFVSTMTRRTHTGFYAIQWGPLPYRFHAPISDRYRVRRIEEFVIFEGDPDALARRSEALGRAIRLLAAVRAMDALGWPPLADLGVPADAPAAAHWDACRSDLAPLAAAAARRCGACATPGDCTACIQAQAAGTDAAPDCAALLALVARRSPTGCRDAADPRPLCRETLRQERALGAGR